MPTTIIMPQLGESVAEGIIGKWLKNEGDQIEKDEPIVEVITDKVNAEIPSPVAGVLERISQPEGATVRVGQEIAVIGDGSQSEPVEEAAAPAAAGQPSHGAGSPPEAGPSGNGGGSAMVGASAAGDGSSAVQVQSRPTSLAATASAADAAAGHNRGERVRSSPLVRRLAEQYGINLAEVSGTGIGGRVSKHDILSYVEQRQQPAPAAATPQPAPQVIEQPATQPAPTAVQPAPAPSPAPAATAQPAAPRELRANESLVPVPALRKMIAERMTQSMFTIPHAVTHVEVDVTNVVRFREAQKDEFRRREGLPLSYVAFVVKATVEALKEFPMVNAEWGGDNIILKKDININVAVDAPEGLTTPVVHHADEKSLTGISKAIYDLATRARDRKLRLEDMQGGTFTVNNTGALGSVGGVSIINYPQVGILAFGAIVKRPVVVEQDGQDLIAVRSMMNISFSFDHRLLDGGYASAFVNAVKAKLESWSQDYPLY